MAVYPTGECTAYVASRVGYVASAPALHDALFWPATWRALGHSVTGVPTAGTPVAFQPGVQGAQGTGHVAYVESVQPDGTFTISEQNCSGCGSPPGGFNRTDTRAGLKPGIGVSFLLPPAGQSVGAVSSLAVAPVLDISPGGILGTIGNLTGIGDWVGTFVGVIINGGEVILGGALALAGLYFLGKETPVAKATGKAAELVPGAPGEAIRAVKAPVRAAKASRAKAERSARAQERAREKDDDSTTRKYLADKSTERAQLASERAEKQRVTESTKLAREEGFRKADAAYRRRTARENRKALKEIPF